MPTREEFSLKDIYKEYFKIGTAVERKTEKFANNEIGNPDKEKLITEQFSSMTFANELKPMYNMGFASERAKEDYLPLEINKIGREMLDWAKANNMPVRGHVLVWHSQCPDEAFCKGYKPIRIPTDPEKLKENPILKRFEKLDPVCFVDRDTMLARLKTYIYEVMDYMYKEGFGRTIYAWDVVNEAIEPMDKRETGLRNSYWLQVIGEDFIYYAFKYANEALDEVIPKYASLYNVDPSDEGGLKELRPLLFYNDYGEFAPDRKKAIIDMFTAEANGHGSIMSEKLITGIGMQSHISDNIDLEQYKEALYEYGSFGLPVHITELDVKCTCMNKNREYYQAVFYKKYFELLIKAKEDGIKLESVTLWGLTDDNSWIRGADPLPFNAELQSKKAFDAMVYAVKGGELGEPEKIELNLEDRFFDFEDAANGEKPDLEKLGFKPLGFCRMELSDKEAHSGKNSVFSPFRAGDWCGVMFDISDFIGQTIEVSAWVKSPAKEVFIKTDNGEKTLASINCPGGNWTEIKSVVSIPSNLHSIVLYFGTIEESRETMSPLYIDEVSIKLRGIVESFEEETNIASIRGAGHLPFLSVTDKESVDGRSHSLSVVRQEKDATVKFNISPYIGKKVSVSLYIKTLDKVAKIGLEGSPSKEVAAVSVKDGWNLIEGVIDIPADLTTAEVYVETDGNAPMYIDDIFVKMI
ncbi:MAG: endo-1,4-beta-xylanase [Lachnospiraceae bacterium]|nr:endo-1,4-beta-xylanase [Lachnospiraceae bacterium]